MKFSKFLFLAVLTSLVSCQPEDPEGPPPSNPTYNKRWAGYVLMPSPIIVFEESGYSDCEGVGNECGDQARSAMTEDQTNALNDFYTAYYGNNLQSFYGSTSWSTLFPSMDQRHTDLLRDLQNNTKKPVVGSDGSIVIIPYADTVLTTTNVELAVDFY